jgi:acetyl-CoA synthetase
MEVDELPTAAGNSLTNSSPVYQPPSARIDQSPAPYLPSINDYHRLYTQSIQNPEEFWATQAKELLHWHRPFTKVLQGYNIFIFIYEHMHIV